MTLAPRVLFVTALPVVPEAELTRRLAAAASLPEASRARLAVQLRDPDRSARERFEVGARLRAATSAIGASFFVNDRIDLALALGADGVHLRGTSVSVADARELFPGAFLTKACHSIGDVLAAAEAGADGALLAPIFATPGKGAPIGFRGLEDAAGALRRASLERLRLYALGGVTEGTALSCFEAGAYGVALIRGDLGSTLAACLAR